MKKKLYYLTISNVMTQKQRQIEKVIEEIWAMEDIKVYYAKTIAKLRLEEFEVFILEMQKWDN